MSDQPLVSVVLPVHNEGPFIEGTLDAILKQAYPPEKLEIIVVDGQSSDDTRARVEAIARQNPYRSVHLVSNPQRIFAAGFNLGLERARGEAILMMGGHAEPCPDYVRRCADELSRSDVQCAGGFIVSIPNPDANAAIGIAMSSPFGVGGVGFRMRPTETKEVDTVAFGLYRRDVFERLGGLDEQMVKNQDDELNMRIRKHGGRIVLLASVSCRYYTRASFAKLWRQYFAYGYWKVRLLQKHPKQMSLRHFVPAAFVGGVIIAGIGSVLVPWMRFLLAAIIGSYVVALGVATLIEAAKESRIRFSLPLAFAFLHVSYGLGFCLGLIRLVIPAREAPQERRE